MEKEFWRKLPQHDRAAVNKRLLELLGLLGLIGISVWIVGIRRGLHT